MIKNNKKYFLFFLIISILFNQHLMTEQDDNYFLHREFNSIESKRIFDDMHYTPFVEKEPSQDVHYNILNKFNYKHSFIIEPVMAVRYSDFGLNMFQENPLALNSSVWISPGIKVHSTIPILKNFSNIWLYTWSTFYKHSAYGFNNELISIHPNEPLFKYNHKYSINFYEPTKSPDNGIDFDEGQGGISLLSSKFQFIFGKFRTKIGPFLKSNLSVSDNAPSFSQFIMKYDFNNKVKFSYLIGSLNSNIPKAFNPHPYNSSVTGQVNYNDEVYNLPLSDLYTDYWNLIPEDLLSVALNNKYIIKGSPLYEKYVVNHRIDFLPIENLRIGFYEQVIFGAKSPPIGYLIPINPMWSSQHEDNDQDNLQIGLDYEYIFKKYRIYGALLLDEWAPFDTFNDDERNWFAYQIGLTRIFNILNKNSLFKIEYSKVDPRAYNHRYIINEPTHNGYYLGYWSGNDSDDLFTNLTVFLNNESIFKIEYHYTRFGNQNKSLTLENQYNNIDVDFLGQNYKYIKNIELIYTFKLKHSIYMDLSYNYFDTNIFNSVNKTYNDINLSIRYNINY